MTLAPQRGHAVLVDLLHEHGLLDADWRRIWLGVPRAAFVPETAWRQTPAGCVPVTGDGRLALLHSDEPVVTRLDDGAPGCPGRLRRRDHTSHGRDRPMAR
ncbi:hypothetical protein [Streptomyces kanasensis]|uniref:hypothetical protein n=1 Tax=Streptomyces kanasensis TaxID=936756 RepID=UPI0038273CD3